MLIVINILSEKIPFTYTVYDTFEGFQLLRIAVLDKTQILINFEGSKLSKNYNLEPKKVIKTFDN